MRSLKTKMTLVTSLLMAGTLSMLSLIGLSYFESQLKQMISTQQFAMVSAIAGQIDDKLQATQIELTAVAGTITPDIVADPARAERFLSGRPDTIAMFDNGVFLYSPAGKLIAGTRIEPQMLGKDFSGRPHFKKTLTTRKPQISQPFLSAQTHRHPIVGFTAPVFDARGKIVAVLAGSLDLLKDNFLGKLATTHLGDKGYLYLYNTSRMMIVHPERDRIMKQDVPPGVNKMFDLAAGGFEGTGETVNSRGLHAISSFKRLKLTDWILAANFPQNEAYAPVYRAQKLVLLVLVVVVTMSVVVVWLFMKHLTVPLLSFTRQVTDIAGANKTKARIEVKTDDEIGVLAESFNVMLAEIHLQKDALHKQLLFSQTLIETIPYPVFYKDAEGRYLGCNQAFECVTGLPAERLIGRSDLDIAPQHLAEMKTTDGEALREGVQIHEATVTYADGSPHDVILFNAALAAVEGGPGGLLGTIIDITDRKRAEKRLQQAVSMLSATLESTTDGIVVRDLMQNVITYNRNFVKMWGFPDSVLSTRDDRKMRLYVLDQIKDPARFLNLTERLYAEPGVESYDIVELKDGRIFERVSKPQVIEKEVVGRVINIRDITAQKNAAKELERINRSLRTLSACNHALVYAADEGSLLADICRIIRDNGDFKLVWVGHATTDASKGVRLAAHAGQDDSYLDAVATSEADFERDSGPIASAIRTGAPCIARNITADPGFAHWQEEARKLGYSSVISLPLTSNGTSFAALTIYSSEPDGFDQDEVELLRELSDNLAYGISALRSRDEHIKAERALHESEERYRSLVENIDLGITLIDNRHRIIMTNAAAAQMLNKPACELEGKLCFEEFEKRTEACAHCAGSRSLVSGKSEAVETEGVRDDGSRFPVRIATFPVFDARANATHFIEVIQDISAQKQAESEKRTLEQQLRHSQKMEAVGTLAGGIAHDFNNILTAITAYCSLIELKTAADSPVRPYLEKLFESTDRATSLTRSLLAYSRSQPFTPQTVDLNVVIGKVENLLSRLLSKDIDLAVLPADGPLTVLADSLEIEQVLMNLATNARDAMPLGGLFRITTARLQLGAEFIKAHGYGKQGSYAVITASDTGCGMDEKVRERIFEPFFTTKEVGRGTGLGLSIAYGIVKQHNGYITVYSEPEAGTTFTVYLPLTEIPEEKKKQPVVVRGNGGNETILLVEDDPEIRATLRELLEGDGYTVVAAADGEEGIGKFRQYQDSIALLILDVVMPKMNGAAALEQIRILRPDVRALFISGYTADLLHAKGVLQAGVNYVAKPVVIDKLRLKIREVLDSE